MPCASDMSRRAVLGVSLAAAVLVALPDVANANPAQPIAAVVRITLDTPFDPVKAQRLIASVTAGLANEVTGSGRMVWVQIFAPAVAERAAGGQ